MNADYLFVKLIKGTHVAVSSMAVSETNDLISGFSDGAIKIWELTNYTCLKVLKKHTEAVVVLVPLPDNELVSCSIHIWQTNTGDYLHSFENKSTFFCVSPTKERILISGSEDGIIGQ